MFRLRTNRQTRIESPDGQTCNDTLEGTGSWHGRFAGRDGAGVTSRVVGACRCAAQALPYVRLAAKSDHLPSLQSTIWRRFFPLKIVWKFLCKAATNLETNKKKRTKLPKWSVVQLATSWPENSVDDVTWHDEFGTIFGAILFHMLPSIEPIDARLNRLRVNLTYFT